MKKNIFLPGFCILLLAGTVFAAGGAVSFSVNGPNDPRYDGLPAPGNAVFVGPWVPPPPPGLGPYPPIRTPIVPWAVGITTARLGDVLDYAVAGVPSEAEIFQSEPNTSQGGTVSNPPAGTNNQIIKDIALGLRPGHTNAQGYDANSANVNAYSFGEDYFNGDETSISESGAVDDVPWGIRTGSFIEPTLGGGGDPITFHFSVDPWAVGLAGTAVQSEATNAGALTLPAGPAGSADENTGGVGTGPWQSDGEASGDVYSASPSSAAGTNLLVYDEAIIALLGPRSTVDLPGMEDDLDALEDLGTNTLSDGTAVETGNTHDRVAPTNPALNPPNGGTHPPDLGNPNNANHDPCNVNPLIFSVDRGTYGRNGSAVQAQVVSGDEGASGDLFIAVTVMDQWGFISTTNMLLIDEGQLGLMPHDDLDAVIVKLNIDPVELATLIDAAAFANYNPDGLSSGDGFTNPLLTNSQSSEAHVGFSVDTSSMGLLGTAVDFECRVDGAGLAIPSGGNGSGLMEQAGDIFYSNLMPPPGQIAADAGTSLLFGQNYLWFEEAALGLDAGGWSFAGGPPSGNLADLPDELNALDSIEEEDEPEPDPCDFGDAPETGYNYPTTLANNGARHIIVAGLLLGSAIDAEADGQPDATATGDDLNGLADEDGVVYISSLVPGGPARVDVSVQDSTGTALLSAWLDFNADGDWADGGEQVATDVSVAPGVNKLVFNVPASAIVGQTFARLRLSTQAGLSYTGAAQDGEIEDHLVDIEQLTCDWPPNEPNMNKWVQPPDETQNGVDVRLDRNDGVLRLLGDDFECNRPGVVTDIHFWASWKDDERMDVQNFTLYIYNDKPKDPLDPDSYSEPNQLLWSHDFAPGGYTERLYKEVLPGEWWWDPYNSVLTQFGDEHMWLYNFCFDPCDPDAFYQEGTEENPIVYWLVIKANVTLAGPEFGWKTSDVPWNDSAVVSFDDGFSWSELEYPSAHPLHPDFQFDLAFAITTEAPWSYPVCWDWLTQCHADADGDGSVGLLDFYDLRDGWSTTYAANPPANPANPQPGEYYPCSDINRDGAVGLLDFYELRDNWSSTVPGDCVPGDMNKIFK